MLLERHNLNGRSLLLNIQVNNHYFKDLICNAYPQQSYFGKSLFFKILS